MSKILGIFAKGDECEGIAREVAHKLGIDLVCLPDSAPAEEILTNCRSAGAILLGASLRSPKIRDMLKESLNLHSSLRKDKSMALVTNATGGIYGKRKGYELDADFGRAAYDAEYFSELEIERVARAAYELAECENKSVTLFDRAPLVTSALWRKITSDINEDYPNVPLNMRDVGELLKTAPDKNAIYLGSRLFGNILWDALGDGGFEAFLGDCPLALYTPVKYALDLTFCLPHMLRFCFALERESEALASCLAPLDPCADGARFLRAIEDFRPAN